MHFGILGPLIASSDSGSIEIGPHKRRTLLAILLCHANKVVSTQSLIRALWPADPPRTARKNLQVHVWQLRRTLGDQDRIAYRRPGYVIATEPGELDVDRFEDLVTEARQASFDGRFAEAAAAFRQAMSLWRGQALDGLDQASVLHEAAMRLEERRLTVLEERVDADLAAGLHADLVAELRAETAAHPLRERFRAQLMLALYRTGRQSEALAAYREARQALVDTLGIEPGPELTRLHAAILNHDPDLQADAPPAAPDTDRATGHCSATMPLPVPAQLPAPPRPFTGRRRQLDTLDGLLRECARDATPVFVITGTAGVGKTALAVYWAHRIRDRFPDGQLYADLKAYAAGPPVPPEEALTHLLYGLGVPAHRIPTRVEAASAMYRSLLADRRVLVLLDNAATPEQVRPLLPAGPGCVVLVTGRDRLGGLVAREGAALVDLHLLSPDEAHALIAAVVGRQRAEAEKHAVTEMAALCAHLPLGLRIAAAHLVGRPGQTIAGYAAKLRQRNRVAELSVDRDDQARVRVAFDQSYATLAGTTRRMFRLVGLAPGSDITAPAAAALADLPLVEAERALDQLAAAHLQQEHQPGRYACHDLLKVYAALRAEEEDDEAARRAALGRLLSWFLDTVRAASRLLYRDRPTEPPTAAAPGFADHRAALSWLDTERANLVSAVEFSAEHGWHQMAWQLADALQLYLWDRGREVGWLRVARAGLAAARAADDLPAQATCQLNLGDLNSQRSRPGSAIDYYRAALGIARRLGNRDLEASALSSLGAVYRQAGRPREAIAPLTQALRLDRQSGLEKPRNIGRLGSVYWELGRLREAADHLHRAYARYEAEGAYGSLAIALTNLGETHYLLGQPDRARGHLERALERYRQVGNHGGEAQALCCMARIHSDAGRHAEATAMASTALRLARKLDREWTVAGALSTLGEVEQNRGHIDEAADAYQQALNLARDIGYPYLQAEAMLGLSRANLRRDRLDRALDLARQALKITNQAGYRILECQTRHVLAEVLRALRQGAPASRQERLARLIQQDTGYVSQPAVSAANGMLPVSGRELPR